jgi:hypothetical protein
VVGRLGAVAAGPVLVRRIQSNEFHGLPVEECRELLATLKQLNARRAEAVAVELLGRKQIVPSQHVERSRVLAAELLADASSDEAVSALEDATKRRWWNTQEVRDAAARSAAAVGARRGGPPASRRS